MPPPTCSACSTLDAGRRGADRLAARRRGRARGGDPRASSSAVGGAAADPAARRRDGPLRRSASSATASTPTCSSSTTRVEGADERDAAGAALEPSSHELRRLLEQRRARTRRWTRRRPAAGGQERPAGAHASPRTRAYYERWSLAWEARRCCARTPVAGDADLGARFRRADRPAALPGRRARAAAVREIRRLKARVEAERLPRGADPRTHLKLGRGGLSDVEWTVQLLQLQHAHARARAAHHRDAACARGGRGGRPRPARRTPAALGESWRLASRLRNASVLFRGRPVDSVPADLRVADGVSRILGGEPGTGAALGETYRRVARRARSA